MKTKDKQKTVILDGFDLGVLYNDGKVKVYGGHLAFHKGNLMYFESSGASEYVEDITVIIELIEK